MCTVSYIITKRVDLKKYIRRIIKEEFLKEDNNDLYYHGSNNRFNEFSLKNNTTYREIDLPTWHFTKDINYAKTYGKYLYTVNLDIKKTFNTENESHYNLYINYLKEQGYSNDKIENIIEEQFYRNLPYWTNEEAYYCAAINGFDSILIQEELEDEVLSIAVFDIDQIQILKISDLETNSSLSKV